MPVTCSNCHFDDCVETDRYCIKCGHRLVRAGSFDAEAIATKRVYDSTVVHVRLGLVYLQNGKKDRAIASWRTALELDPENREARALLEKYGPELEQVTGADSRAAEQVIGGDGK